MRLAGRLDSDLAALYEVPTKVFNQTIQRNAARFPVYFAFQPTREKVANLKSQFVTSRSKGTCALWSQIVILEINGTASIRSTVHTGRSRTTAGRAHCFAGKAPGVHLTAGRCIFVTIFSLPDGLLTDRAQKAEPRSFSAWWILAARMRRCHAAVRLRLDIGHSDLYPSAVSIRPAAP
jgi:ORF6N domain